MTYAKIDGHVVELFDNMTKYTANGPGDRDEIVLADVPEFVIVTDIEALPVPATIYGGPFFVLETSGWETEFTQSGPHASLAEAYAWAKVHADEAAAAAVDAEANTL